MLHPSGTVYHQGYFAGKHHRWQVAVAEIGMGGVSAAQEAEKAIGFFQARIALFVGIAGGLKDVQRGDVVVATKIYAYESGKAGRRFEPRPDIGHSSYALEQRARAEAHRDEWLARLDGLLPDSVPHVYIGALAAGEKVLTSTRSRLAQLLKTTYGDALAIEMEGHGFLHAVRLNHMVHGLVIRGISDLIDDKSVADAAGSQQLAARHAAAFAFQVLATFTPPTPDGSSSPAVPAAVRNVPYPRNPYFTGREDELKALHEALGEGNIVALRQIQAISGLGGVGKTQTALEYSYRYRNEYNYVFWVNAESGVALRASFLEIAELLGLQEHNASGSIEGLSEHTTPDPDKIVCAVKRWLENRDDWLLIFDNADDPALLKTYQLPNPKGHILLTSRAQVFDMLGIIYPIELKEMLPDEARAFLFKRTGRNQHDHAERQAAAELAKQLGYLPLALEQASAYITAKQVRLQDYIASYQGQRLQLLKKSGPRVGDYSESVATTWAMNFQEIEKAPAAADILCLSAFLEPDHIPLELIAKGASRLGPTLSSVLSTVTDDPVLLNEMLEPLTRYSLIHRDIDGHSYSIHRLVQEVMKDRMGIDTQRLWSERVVRAIEHVFPQVEEANWPLCQRYLSQAIHDARLIEQWSMKFPEAVNVLERAGTFLIEQGQYLEAKPLFQQALTICEQIFGPEFLYVDIMLNGLGAISQKLGKFEEAEAYYIRALAIRRKFLAPEHPAILLSLNNLGSLYNAQGQYEKAEPILRQVLSVREKTLGPESPELAFSLSNLAFCSYKLGKYQEAEPLYERALAIREKSLGKEHHLTAQSLSNLALNYKEQDKDEQAELLFKRALKIREKTLGREHPDTAISLNNLGTLYDKQDKQSEAEPLFEQALAICEQKLGYDHPTTPKAVQQLGNCYEKQGKYEQSKALYERVLTICDQQRGSEHPHTILLREKYQSFMSQLLRTAQKAVERQ